MELKGVSETLIIPLYAQWRENRSRRPVLRDDKVDDIVARLKPPFEKFLPSPIDRSVVVLRKRIIDGLVAAHMRRNRGHAVVVNLGCGLCTRFDRIDDGAVRWIDVDLSAVEPVWRFAFAGHDSRRHFVTASIEAEDLLESLHIGADDVPLFILEGVSMYLSEARMRLLCRRIAKRFPGATLVFDAMASWVAMGSIFYPEIAVTGSRFTWRLDRPQSCESWGRDFKITADEPIARHLNAIYGFAGWLGRLNPVMRSAYRVVALRLGKAR
ncbi:class I SAM-dependent methyltransferase [Zavarzinia aquatilis]|uniref:Class I SAM-dependent methyltransferase n=1 Tax=Zavarzinia aquatilis TaxID=2211142 RepID=A0A317EGG0_9PROT|nr:class I SAM-dependent methyltransferase [Zavarzinia aquatilis]PWR25949.1 hypothetical protein DKG74_03090 [Zavarzinia aquatilis]